MEGKKTETVCGYSCSDCDHKGNECRGCVRTMGSPFWTHFAGIETCPVYDCCVNDRKLPHCGRCPDLVCERFTRYTDPDMSPEQASDALIRMEQELRSRG